MPVSHWLGRLQLEYVYFTENDRPGCEEASWIPEQGWMTEISLMRCGSDEMSVSGGRCHAGQNSGKMEHRSRVAGPEMLVYVRRTRATDTTSGFGLNAFVVALRGSTPETARRLL